METDFDTSKIRVGSLCKKGHEYKDTGMSLRYKVSNNCVECNKIASKRFYSENKEKYTEIYNKKYLSNPEKVELARKSRRKRYLENRDAICAKNRERYYKNKDKYLSQQRKHYNQKKESKKQYLEQQRLAELQNQGVKMVSVEMKKKKRIAPVAIPKEEQFISLKKQIEKMINL
jgi:hypothetical protein